jgi:hypothetical protein
MSTIDKLLESYYGMLRSMREIIVFYANYLKYNSSTQNLQLTTPTTGTNITLKSNCINKTNSTSNINLTSKYIIINNNTASPSYPIYIFYGTLPPNEYTFPMPIDSLKYGYLYIMINNTDSKMYIFKSTGWRSINTV